VPPAVRTSSILVVEDEPAVLRVIGRALERAGYDPLLRGTAAEGRAVPARAGADAKGLQRPAGRVRGARERSLRGSRPVEPAHRT